MTENGTPHCGRRVKHCRKCSFHFTKEDYELHNCPDCGEARHCTQPGTGVGDHFTCDHCNLSFGGACKRFHGGSAKVGIESPRFKHGGDSKYVQRFQKVPQRMHTIMESIADDVLDLTDLAIVLKARFYDVVGKTNNRGDSEESIKQALRHCEEMDAAQRELTRLGEERKQALARQDTAAADRLQSELEKQSAAWNTAWANVKQALKQDLADWQLWNNAVHLAEKTTRVVESQRKGMVEARLVMAIDRVEKIYGSMIEAVNEEVQDEATLERIQTKFMQIALAGFGTGVEALESHYQEQ